MVHTTVQQYIGTDGSPPSKIPKQEDHGILGKGGTGQHVESGSGEDTLRATVIRGSVFLIPVLSRSGISDVYHGANDGKDPVRAGLSGGPLAVLTYVRTYKKGGGLHGNRSGYGYLGELLV